jgi:hypothetical protein
MYGQKSYLIEAIRPMAVEGLVQRGGQVVLRRRRI